MKLSIPNCPECGQPATGTLETVQGVALLQGPDSKGSFEYIGETVIDWDSQPAVLILGPAGNLRGLVCGVDGMFG
jgi:hypothetical protein